MNLQSPLLLRMLDDIEQHHWPSSALLDELPFGHDLAALTDPERDPRENRDTPGHVRAVVKKALAINKGGLAAVIQEPPQPLLFRMADFEIGYVAIFEDPVYEARGWSIRTARGFIAACALYHDIGKIIQRERHPTIGYYHMLTSPESEPFRELFMTELDYWLFLHVIRFHEVFGVVSTGEGAIAALTDMIPLREMSDVDRMGILHLFLRVNLADIAGTVPVRARKITALMDDLERAAAATPSGGTGSTPHAGVGFREALIRSDASVGRAVARIERLLAEPGLPEYAGPGMDIMIERELCAIMGSAVHGFAATFAHVCKLDYLLRFVRAMEKYALDSGRKPRAMVGAFVALLCRVVQEYSDLTYRRGDGRRRIGINCKGWSREPGVTLRMCQLLFDDPHLALQWATEEASAWFYD